MSGDNAGKVAKVTKVSTQKFAISTDSHGKCSHKFSDWELKITTKSVAASKMRAARGHSNTTTSSAVKFDGQPAISAPSTRNRSIRATLPELVIGDDIKSQQKLVEFTALVVEKVCEEAAAADKYGAYQINAGDDGRPVPSPFNDSSSTGYELNAKLNTCKTEDISRQEGCVDWMNRRTRDWQGKSFVQVLVLNHYVCNGYTGSCSTLRRSIESKLLHPLKRDYYRFLYGEHRWHTHCSRTSYQVEPEVPDSFRAYVETHLLQPLTMACHDLCDRLMKQWNQRRNFIRKLLLNVKSARVTWRVLATTAISEVKQVDPEEKERDTKKALDQATSDRDMFILYGVYSGSRRLNIMDEALGLAYEDMRRNGFRSDLLPIGWDHPEFRYDGM